MSIRHIPYPDDFDVNHEVANLEERRRRILHILDVGDVLAQIDDLIARESDPAKHPCHDLVAWLLDQRGSPGNGAHFWDAWKRLCLDAIDALVDEALTQGED